MRLSARPAGFLPRAALAVAACLCAGSARAADWSVNKADSKLGFTASQSGLPFHGRFKAYDAQISFDPAKPEGGHATVTIDMTSATTGDKQKDESLPQDDWFSTGKFPQARFVATSFRAKGGDAYEAVGTLSIRGISHDVVLPFTLTVAGDTAHAVGHLPLVRTDFGVGQGEWSNGDLVALAVTVDLDLKATRVPGS